MASLEIVNLQKQYRRKAVLKNVTLSAGEGACVGILGSNGSGKSTLLRTLAGMTRADGGAFRFQGADLLSDARRRSALVGYVPQGTPLLSELTAWDNLRLWYRPAALKRELDQGVLALLGIPEFLKTPVSRMSGGMKKRLSIGCAVANDPQILLLDEPCAALDLVCKERILNYLRLMQRRGGIILMATHDVQELSVCTSCCMLRDGVAVPYEYTGDLSRLVGDLEQ